LSGGSNRGAGPFFASSTNPEERKSAQEGVVGLPIPIFLECGVDLRPCGFFFMKLLSSSSSSSSNTPENPISSNLDQEASVNPVESLDVET
jgi:hypothetical protein